MKHLIILNNKSGNYKNLNNINSQIEDCFKNLDYEVYKTTGPRKVVSYLRNYLHTHKGEAVRIYSCGGDGTAHEVTNGIVGFDNAELAIFPIGTGNDFIKIYKNKDSFKDFSKLINGQTIKIDLSKITSDQMNEPWYSINVINFGFDAVVGAKGNKYKSNGIKDPYGKALVDAIVTARYNKITVTADGKKLNNKTLLLCTLAQGQYVGGKFKCAPKSSNTDGLIDVCLIKTMPFFEFGMLMNPYTNGNHLDKPNSKIIYKVAKEISIDAPKTINVCVDGEMMKGKSFKVVSIPKAINFVIPD